MTTLTFFALCMETKKVNNSCMPRPTVKDFSRILCPSLSDAKDIQCRGTASPNTSSNGLNHHFNNLFITKETTIVHHYTLLNITM